MSGDDVYHVRRVETLIGDIVVVKERHRLRHPYDQRPTPGRELPAFVRTATQQPRIVSSIYQQRPEGERSTMIVNSPNSPRPVRPLGSQSSRDLPMEKSESPSSRSSSVSVLSTPLRTPDIERLPTPDLPELKLKSFCECCSVAQVGQDKSLSEPSLEGLYRQ